MSSDGHSYEACTRAYGALARAHEAVQGRLTRDLGEGFGLSINEFDALVALDGAPSQALRMMDLEEMVSLSQPSISRLVDRLAERGLLARQGRAQDRRSVLVALTPDGRALLQQAIPVHARALREALLDRLTSDERDAFKTILLKVGGTDEPATRIEKAS